MRRTLVTMGVIAGLLGVMSCGICKGLGSTTDKAVLKAVVHSVALGLGAIIHDDGGTINKPMIRQFVNAARFLDDQTGYFFVYDYKTNVNIAHATLKNFPNTDKTKYKDSRGMYVIQELSKIAKSKARGGFLVYYWNNPKTRKEEKKLGYIETIPGTTLYIGSGIYAR